MSDVSKRNGALMAQPTWLGAPQAVVTNPKTYKIDVVSNIDQLPCQNTPVQPM
jgi:hypothetical protein